jgi:predicted PurR-regulated permease PerM
MNQKQWSIQARYFTLAILVILFFIALWYIRTALKPLVVAAFIAYLISPAVSYLEARTRLSRRAAANIIYWISILVLVGAPASLASLFFDEFKQILSDILNLIDQLIAWMIQPHVFGGLYIDFSQLANQLTQFRTTFLPSLSENALNLLEQTSLGALWILVVLVAVYYLINQWANLRGQIINSFPEEYHEELGELYQRVRHVWMSYLRGQILLMFIVGIVFTIAWMILGIPGALALGVTAGFFTLVPDVGPFLAVVLAAGVALLEGSSWIPLPNIGVTLIVIAIYLLLINIKNFWLRPYIMGRSVHMPEALVFIFIIIATVLGGILGALLIIPVMASLGVMFSYLRRRVLGMTPFAEPAPEKKTEMPAIWSKLRLFRKREKK